MAIDVGDFFAKAGIDPGAYGPRNTATQVPTQGKPSTASSFSPTNLMHSIGNVLGGAVSAVGHAAVDGFTGLYGGTQANLQLRSQGNNLATQDKFITDRQAKLETSYKNGQITKDQYKQGYKELLSTSNQNIQAHQKFTADTQQKYYSAGKVATDYAKAAGTVLTAAAPFATAGAGLLSAVPGAEKVAGAIDSTLAAGQGSKALIGKAVRNAVVTQPTIQQGSQVVGDLGNKKFASAAESAAQFAALSAAPGIVGKYAPKVADAVGTAVFGKAGSEINKLKFQDGAVSDFLSTLSGTAQKKYTNIAKLVNQRIADEGRTAGKVAQYYAGGKPITDTTVKEFLDQASKHISAEKAIVKDVAQGVHPGLSVGDGKKVIASRWDAGARSAVVEQLQNGADIKQLIHDGTIPNNPGLIAEINKHVDAGDIQGINKIFAASPVGKSVAAAHPPIGLSEVDRGYAARWTDITPKEVSMGKSLGMSPQDVRIAKYEGTLPPEMSKLTEVAPKAYPGGYVPSIAPKGAANYVTPSKAAELAANIEAKPGLGKIGRAITKAGLSPVANEPGALQSALKTNLNTELGKLDPNLEGKGSSLYSSLLNKAGDTRGVTDIRLLSKRALGQVLRDEGISSITPGQLKSALSTAQLRVPAELQSLGGKLTSAAIKYVPGEKTLLKAQSYGRFGINPIFAGKVGIKAGYLGAVDSHGGPIIGKVSNDVAAYVGDAKQFGGLVQDTLGTPGARAKGGFGVDKFQQHVAGNLVQNILKKNGASLEDIAKNPALKQQVDHAVQMIYGYPKGGVLDSNLMKSLNVAVFPARFEAKILGATAKAIINQPPVVRASILNGLLKTQNFLNSPEGQQWKKDNSELVDVARYFTPLDTLSKVMSAVTGQGHGVNLKDLGAIGGLPFGVFTQILTGQGVNLGPFGSSDYVPTKTGVAIGRQIPQTTKARIATALGDIISQSFSYPGAQIGLKSKSSIVKTAVDVVAGGNLKTNKSDFKTVGGGVTQGPTSASNNIPTLKGIKIPSPKAPSIVPIYKRSKASKAKTLAKRRGQAF